MRNCAPDERARKLGIDFFEPVRNAERGQFRLAKLDKRSKAFQCLDRNPAQNAGSESPKARSVSEGTPLFFADVSGYGAQRSDQGRCPRTHRPCERLL